MSSSNGELSPSIPKALQIGSPSLSRNRSLRSINETAVSDDINSLLLHRSHSYRKNASTDSIRSTRHSKSSSIEEKRSTKMVSLYERSNTPPSNESENAKDAQPMPPPKDEITLQVDIAHKMTNASNEKKLSPFDVSLYIVEYYQRMFQPALTLNSV